MAKGKFKSLSITEPVYNKIKEIASRRGFSTLADTIAYLVTLDDIITTSSGNVTTTSGNIIRKFEDLINAYTSKIDEQIRKDAEIIERIDELKELIQSITKTSEKSGKSDKEGKPKKDLCEILADEGVIYESEIVGKIKNRDSFFRKLENVCSAEVFEAKGQRVAIDKGFFEEFMKKLESLDTNDESKIKKVLGTKGHKLLKTLWEGGLVYYDSVNKRWVLSEPESEGEEELEDIDYV